ncbi:MAG: DUF2249 domain-containing protein [Alphaproteobacteria bacterium]|nr:DUF2249 domain-containing protein [Alphaproteobacteria bacterium]
MTYPCGDPEAVLAEVGRVSPSDDPETGETVLDLRALPPPGPFIAILRHIEGLSREVPGEKGGEGERGVLVRLSRDPKFLYPELVDRGWTWEPLPAPAGEVRLRLVGPGGGGTR